MYTLNIENPNNVFFTSDTHFNHYNIIRYCHRPFESVVDMECKMIDYWNNVVPEDGVVIHCGDFLFTRDEGVEPYLKYMKRLNGLIILVRGNHDTIPLSEEPQDNLLAVVDNACIIVDGVKIYASHYPCLAFNGDYQVFGHIHTLVDGTSFGVDPSTNMRKNQYDVGVDQNNYRPISYFELCDKFRKMNSNKNLF